MDLLDTAWCPVCDRQIQPEIITTPGAAPTIVASPSAAAAPPAPQPIKTRGGTIKAAAGARRPAAGHARSKSSATVPTIAASSSPPKAPKPPKLKTYISQAPTPLYCSPECELRDAMANLTLAIPSSPVQATYNAYGRQQPPSSPIMISGSSSSSEAGGSYGSPFSTNSDYFAYLEGRPRRPSQTANTGSSAESLSSLNQLSSSRALPPTRQGTASAARSRRPSSSSLVPRQPHAAGYAYSPPSTADSARQYTLSFTRAPASTASPSSSPPAISIMPGYVARRDRSQSRASSSLRDAAGFSGTASSAASTRHIPRSASDMSAQTPRPYTPLSEIRRGRNELPADASRPAAAPAQVKEKELKDDDASSRWWSWNRYPVPTYEAMPVRAKEGSPDALRKRMFYFQQ